MQGMSSLHTVLASGIAPYLRFLMMRKFVLRSTLYAFDINPMEKNRKNCVSKAIGLTENKKEHSSDDSEDSKTKKNARLPWKKIKNVKRTLVFHGRRRIF